MAPKKKPVQEEEVEVPPEPEEPEIVEGDETELETGLKLPLRPNDVGQIWALQTDYAAQSKLLTQLLGLETAHSLVARRDIICDFHLFNLAHAKTICLSQRQGAVFHAIMSHILDMMAGWEGQEGEKIPAQEAPGAAECFQEYQRLLLMHAVNDPPSRLLIFGGSEARRLTDFTSTTLFKHFLLYQFCARCERDVQTLRFNIELARPAPPPDLAVARLKPSRRLNDSQNNLEETEGAGGTGQEAAAADKEAPSEEDEIERIVQEKLRETEAKLQAKLAEREQKFRDRKSVV